MPSSDIYHVQESPWAKKQDNPPVSRRRRRSNRSFDEEMNKDLSQTHRRRRKNSGFRRFRHLLKKPEFSRRFWITVLVSMGIVLVALVIWDRFFRSPEKPDYSQDPAVYEMETE